MRKKLKITVEGATYDVLVEEVEEQSEAPEEGASSRRTRIAKPSDEPDLFPSLGGVVVEVMVTEGQEVEFEEHVAVIEAMKIENVVRAHRSGVVRNLAIEKGQTVETNYRLMTIE